LLKDILESGVRGLEAKIAQVIRNAAKSVAMEEYNKVTDGYCKNLVFLD
jgi:ATP-dependent Lon protease